MRPFTLAGMVLLTLSVIVLATTFTQKRETVVLPLSTEQGYTGNITLDMPTQVIAGDKVKLTAFVRLDEGAGLQAPVTLSGRVEAGFEEVTPAGLVSFSFGKLPSVEMDWFIRTATDAVYPGKLWLWLSSEVGENLALARDFKVASRTYLGLRVDRVRIGAFVFIAVSIMMLVFDLFRHLRDK